ncbi:DUF2235 domain-containing protein [Mycobacterium sp. 21AC1]|uniref:DUF2235 domain-containing protein n=1 Tax=[Mycobacterium] appelbergii TaxID=2939269 RepID=UPI0029391BDD|nr:DUF2235 domain-containing protein [Mycobacterium sp. 21AC1]MDV3127691.1 DUF2235 domain-containing protein [Mycobacterium sp. 21AC1]
MKNIVLCFDQADERSGPHDATNTQALFRLLDTDEQQVGWYHNGATPAHGAALMPGRRSAVVRDSRAAVIDAYRFVDSYWEPGDHIFLFGGGHGGHRARELATLLGTVGLLPARSDDLGDYALATYVLPTTARTPQDWHRVSRLTAQLLGDDETAIPVRFLGTWDGMRIPGSPQFIGPLTNIDGGRHAVAIDGGRHTIHHCDAVDEVWFRGAHCDIAGGYGACWPLADIALDWVLTGAVEAGLLVADRLSSPTELDALAGSAPTIGLHRPPLDARVHASVEVHLQAHPQYWRRLPARIEWADADWLARGERLVTAPTTARVEREILTAAAS